LKSRLKFSPCECTHKPRGNSPTPDPPKLTGRFPARRSCNSVPCIPRNDTRLSRFSHFFTPNSCKVRRILYSFLFLLAAASADKNGVTTNMTDFGDMHKITNLDDFDLSVSCPLRRNLQRRRFRVQRKNRSLSRQKKFTYSPSSFYTCKECLAFLLGFWCRCTLEKRRPLFSSDAPSALPRPRTSHRLPSPPRSWARRAI